MPGGHSVTPSRIHPLSVQVCSTWQTDPIFRSSNIPHNNIVSQTRTEFKVFDRNMPRYLYQLVIHGLESPLEVFRVCSVTLFRVKAKQCKLMGDNRST